MINSLSNDSHINRYFCSPIAKCEDFTCKSSLKGISLNTVHQDHVSFKGTGTPFAKLANSPELGILIKDARETLGDVKKHEEVVSFLTSAVEHLKPALTDEGKIDAEKIKTPSNDVLKFIEKHSNSGENKVNLKEILDNLSAEVRDKNLVKIPDRSNPNGEKIFKYIKDKDGNLTEEIESRLNESELRDETVKTFKRATNVQPGIEKSSKFWQSEKLANFLVKADKNNVTFSAGFALLLTCLLRPASIMVLPSDKKNKDDQKYAAAHSIASGIIGYCISTIVSNPVTGALKKVLDNPSKYMKNQKNGKPSKMADYLEASLKANNCAKLWITRSVDIAAAVPKALITIALIPPILKYVFGWEKKKPAEKNNIADQQSSNIANDPRTQKFQESMEASK